MNIRLFNARLLTVSEEVKVSDEGYEVWVEGDRISYAGPAKDPGEKKWDLEKDLKGKLIMPGFKNGHTHSGMSFLRSNADDLPLDKWLHDRVFPLEAALTGEDIYWCTLLSCLEYIRNGVTSICEMYLTPYDIARATESIGMRCVQCGCVNNFSQTVDGLKECYEKLNSGNPLTEYRLGIHAEYTCSEELLEGVAALAKSLKAPVYTHISETAAEVAGCKERTSGLSPVEYLAEKGLFEYGGTVFHGVHVDEKDMDIFKEKNVSVVINPCSNSKLASGIAPVKEYLEKGVSLGLGTDGPASNNSLDMFKEMYLAGTLGKLKNNDAAAIDAREVLKMATAGSARAIGLDKCDDIAPGKKADITVIDLMSPNMQPINNIAKNLVYSGNPANICLTMIDGRILFEDGCFALPKDCPGVEEIYRKVQEVIDRLDA